jgi:hypothetical protein
MSTSEMGPMLRTMMSTSTTAGGPTHTPPNKTFSNFLFYTSEIRSDAVVVPPEEIVQESRDVLVIVHLRGPGELFEGHT